MAFHELATNALKHGALASPAGRLNVLWTTRECESGPEFTIVWKELGGPPTDVPGDEGFGTKVLLRLTPAALSGTSRLEATEEGILWTLTVPLSAVTDIDPDSR
jgi:two-component sensor histidine kinase